MRVFLPSTLPALAEALRTGYAGQQPGYAVTPALREAYASGDEEELEYAALTEAARASLRMLAGNPAAASVSLARVGSYSYQGVPVQPCGRVHGAAKVDSSAPGGR